jgi:hypothetical protein
LEGLAHLAESDADGFGEEFGFVAKVRVDGAGAETGSASDLLDASAVVALFGEDLGGGFEESFPDAALDVVGCVCCGHGETTVGLTLSSSAKFVA